MEADYYIELLYGRVLTQTDAYRKTLFLLLLSETMIKKDSGIQ